MALEQRCQSLILNGNSLDSHGFATLGNLLRFNTCLERLHLKRERLSAANSTALWEGLLETPTTALKELVLNFCRFADPSSLNTFCEALKHNATLEHLDLGGCYLNDSQVAQLLTALTGHSNLKKLVLTLNSCHEQGSQALGKLLAHPNCKLSYLNLSHQRDDKYEYEQQNQNAGQQLQPQDKVRIESLSRGLASNTSLEYLKISRNRLEDADIIPLIQALKRNTTLKTLDLNNNELTMSDGVECIGEALPQWKGLETLHLLLRCNNIDTAVKSCSLVSGIERNTRLKTLQLSESFPFHKEVQYWCAMNRAGRHLLHSKDDIPSALWTHVLAKNSIHNASKIENKKPRGKAGSSPFHNDSLYHLLRQGSAVLHR